MKKKRFSKSTQQKKFSQKGRLGAGTLYAVLALLIITIGAVSMIGSVIPNTSTSPSSGQPVIIGPADTQKEKDNLQLYTFPGATYTPTPRPTTPPAPDQNSESGDGSNIGGNKNNKDKTPGNGNSIPDNNGGNNTDNNSGGSNNDTNSGAM